MLQKIIQVGNSLAVTIPRDFVRQVRLRQGEEVAVETDVASKTFLVKPKQLAGTKSLTPEFFSWLKKTIEEYRPILEELANK